MLPFLKSDHRGPGESLGPFHPKSLRSYFVSLIVAVCAILPPIDFQIRPPTEYYPWIVLGAAFLGFFLIFCRVTSAAPLTAVTGFLLCFSSSAPFISFNAYVSIVACCYLFLAARYMNDWDPVWNTVKTLASLSSVLLIFQIYGHDPLLNFGLAHPIQFGFVGQHMIAASFFVILTAWLIQIHPGFIGFLIITGMICNSSWAVFCGVAGGFILLRNRRLAWGLGGIGLLGFLIMAGVTGKLHNDLFTEASRLHVWQRTVELTLQRPWTGWGPGTFKVIFPVLSQIDSLPWKTAHNDWLQFLFELGIPAGLVLLAGIVGLLWSVRHERPLLAGGVMIALDMCVHFPGRTFNCVPLMLLFLAYTLRLRYSPKTSRARSTEKQKAHAYFRSKARAINSS